MQNCSSAMRSTRQSDAGEYLLAHVAHRVAVMMSMASRSARTPAGISAGQSEQAVFLPPRMERPLCLSRLPKPAASTGRPGVRPGNSSPSAASISGALSDGSNAAAESSDRQVVGAAAVRRRAEPGMCRSFWLGVDVAATQHLHGRHVLQQDECACGTQVDVDVVVMQAAVQLIEMGLSSMNTDGGAGVSAGADTPVMMRR